MNKMKAGMALGAAAAIALAGLSMIDSMFPPPRGYHQAARVETPVFPTPLPMTADEEFQTLLPTLVNGDPNVRGTGLEALAMAFKRGAGKELGGDTRAETAQSLIDLYDGETSETAKSRAIKEEAMRQLLKEVGGPEARAFAAVALSSEDAGTKTAALKILASGWIGDADIRNAAYAAAHTDGVPEWVRPAVLRRTLGAASEGELLALMSSTEDIRTIKHCAVELQNLHKPRLMGAVLSRLEEAGLLGDVKILPWFSGGLLSKHIENADDDELLRALRVVWLRPTLTRTTMKAVEKRLAHADPGIRRLVARIIPDAVKHRGLELESGEELLAARLRIENDPAVKGELEGSLTEVRETRRTTQRTEPESGTGE